MFFIPTQYMNTLYGKKIKNIMLKLISWIIFLISTPESLGSVIDLFDYVRRPWRFGGRFDPQTLGQHRQGIFRSCGQHSDCHILRLALSRQIPNHRLCHFQSGFSAHRNLSLWKTSEEILNWILWFFVIHSEYILRLPLPSIDIINQRVTNFICILYP